MFADALTACGKTRRILKCAGFACVILLAVPIEPTFVFAAVATDALSSPADEARARALQKEFRCLVCQGQSLDESDAPLAADLRHLIRQRIKMGDTNGQIEHYLVARYGDFILMKPPFEPSTYVLWLAPIAVLAIGGLVALTVVRGAGRRAGT